ncbi:MAG TPA: type II toxin-antitoxin system prevent-host-death family antitoxin [Thermoanaerobaculia bacterium]|nr:type II toxin-antitoxin system prevent-host-death family antitoxin [Thermoanaerobaculia bacterium]
MNEVTLKEAELNLEQLVKKVLADKEPTAIVLERGARVVVVPFDEYKSWQETAERLWNSVGGDSGGWKWNREEAYDRPILRR